MESAGDSRVLSRDRAAGALGRVVSLAQSAERVPVPLSSAPDRDAYRRRRDELRLGWNFENCIASTSVLEIRCGPRSSNEFSARSNARGLCDFKL